jgi:copper chaperone CopZ
VVQEALSGLPGVRSIQVDLKTDLLRIDYDPGQVTPQGLLEVVGKQGFEGTVVAEDR